MDHESSAADNLDSLKTVLHTMATQLNDQLRGVLDRTEKLTTTALTIERTLPGELSTITQALGRTAQEEQLKAVFSRVEGLKDAHAEIKQVLQQQLGAVAQIQAGLADLSKSGGVQQARLEGAVGRLETLGNQTLERLTGAAGGLQTGQTEQRQQLTALLRDLAQLAPVLAKAVTGTEAIRGELTPIASTLHQVRESQRTADGVLHKLDSALSATLPQQVDQVGSDVRTIGADLKPLATGVTELKTQTGLLLPSIQQAVQFLPEQMRQWTSELVESSAADNLDSLKTVLSTMATQLNDQLRGVLDRTEKLTTTALTIERTLPGELSTITQALGRTAQEEQLKAVFSRVEGLKDAHAEIKQVLQQQLGAVAQIQAGLADLSKSGGVQQARLEGAVGRLETLGNQTLERLTGAAGGLQTGQTEQRQQLTALLRDLAQLAPVLAKAVTGTEAIRGELTPIASTLHQVRESQRTADGVLHKLDSALSATLPQQVDQVGSDVRTIGADLKPLATGVTELKTQTDRLLPSIHQAVQFLPEQMRQLTSELVNASKTVEQINKEFSSTSLSEIKKIVENETTNLTKIAIEGFGGKFKLTASERLMRVLIHILSSVVFPAACAYLAFSLLQRGNESMNVKRLDELVAEKKILHTAEQSCQTDLSTAKLDVQRAQAELTHRIEKEKEKAKDAETVKPPPPIPKPACPRKQLGGKCLPPLPDAGSTLKIEGTVRVEPTAKPSGPADGQTRPTPAPSKPSSPSTPK